jgi:hypothetical protein
MAVGWSTDKLAIDSTAGQLVFDVRESLQAVADFKDWLDQQTDEVLTAKGYVAGDITLLRAGIFDMDKLHQIAHAQAQQVGNNDFFFHAGKLTGTK